MNAVLDVESPQLVILNGDLITGENTYLHNSSQYVDEIVRPLVQRGLPWASTYGNHDSQYNLSRQEIFAREHLYPNSLTGNMVLAPNAGVSNYFLPVHSSNPLEVVPELLLWFFDSRGGNYFRQLDENGDTLPQPEWVDESVGSSSLMQAPLIVQVADWFKATNKALTAQYGKTIPSLAFYHIPVNAMLAFQNTTVNPNKEPGINDDVPLAQQGDDSNGDYIGTDIPFMAAMLDTPGLMATFSGHDHGDDWCFKWNSKLPGMTLTGNGLDLCFGRHTGYGGYGNWMRGGSQIMLDLKTLGKTTKTWVRLEDRSISGLIMLNATYGNDLYPTVEDSMTYLPDD